VSHLSCPYLLQRKKKGKEKKGGGGERERGAGNRVPPKTICTSEVYFMDIFTS